MFRPTDDAFRARAAATSRSPRTRISERRSAATNLPGAAPGARWNQKPHDWRCHRFGFAGPGVESSFPRGTRRRRAGTFQLCGSIIVTRDARASCLRAHRANHLRLCRTWRTRCRASRADRGDRRGSSRRRGAWARAYPNPESENTPNSTIESVSSMPALTDDKS